MTQRYFGNSESDDRDTLPASNYYQELDTRAWVQSVEFQNWLEENTYKYPFYSQEDNAFRCVRALAQRYPLSHVRTILSKRVENDTPETQVIFLEVLGILQDVNTQEG
jgi:hypothetical protein